MEKSRVISQNIGDRNFHVFYQIFESSKFCDENQLLKLGLIKNANGYRFLNQGKAHNQIEEKFRKVDDSTNGFTTQVNKNVILTFSLGCFRTIGFYFFRKTMDFGNYCKLYSTRRNSFC